MSMDHLKKMVTDTISEDPSRAKEILQAAIDGLDGYEQAVQRQRSTDAYLAIEGLVNQMEITETRVRRKGGDAKWRCVTGIRAVIYLFPRGFDSAMSNATEGFLQDFCRDYFGEEEDLRPEHGLHLSDWEERTIGCRTLMELLRYQWFRKAPAYRSLKGRKA